MQLLGNGSEDGETEGLGLIPLSILTCSLPIVTSWLEASHVGFDTVSVDLDTQLFKGFNREVDFILRIAIACNVWMHQLFLVLAGMEKHLYPQLSMRI